jgi:hypothetical protein
MKTDSKDERPVLPEASRSIVLKRDRRLERKLRQLSAEMQEQAEKEEREGRASVPAYKFLDTVVRHAT